MVRLNRIYTRTGDDGTSGLVDGSRVSKASPLMAAIGDVDEANSTIGVATVLASGPMRERLTVIQNDLFDLGADIATPGDPVGWDALRIIAAQVDRIEHEIDTMNATIAPLTSFVPAGRFCAGGGTARRARDDAAGQSAARSRPIRSPRSTPLRSRISTACPTGCSWRRASPTTTAAPTFSGFRARRADAGRGGRHGGQARCRDRRCRRAIVLPECGS